MSAPATNGNPHLPVDHVPGDYTRDQITDLCNYTVLSALAHELNKVYSGAYTFAELRDAAATYAARADAIGGGRSWPTVDVDALNASHALATSSVPDEPPTAGTGKSGSEPRVSAPSRQVPAPDTFTAADIERYKPQTAITLKRPARHESTSPTSTEWPENSDLNPIEMTQVMPAIRD